MKLSELNPSVGGESKKVKRVGRGMSSGHGKTSGRGHKGQNARSGRKPRLTFEGGQLELFRRLPKRGFTNKFAKNYVIVNIDELNAFEEGMEITPDVLLEAGMIKQYNRKTGVKVLGNGDLDKKLTIKAHKFSKSAVEKIESAGGKIEVI